MHSHATTYPVLRGMLINTGEVQMKILNLYAGIGGNRKLWGDEHEITAVELNPQIAKIYQDFFPNDKIIIGDAHQYLLEHFKEFDFIWSSPPCPSHSSFRKNFSCANGSEPIYPDMKLYEEVLLLKGYGGGLKYCIENVISWYDPLIPPQELQRHYFWCNFHISALKKFGADNIKPVGRLNPETAEEQIKKLSEKHGFDLSNYEGINKMTALRNCVTPELGLHILNESKREVYKELFK